MNKESDLVEGGNGREGSALERGGTGQEWCALGRGGAEGGGFSSGR